MTPISRRLSGVKANPCAEGDDVPPYKLSKEETTDEKIILEKEFNVFDRITKKMKLRMSIWAMLLLMNFHLLFILFLRNTFLVNKRKLSVYKLNIFYHPP